MSAAKTSALAGFLPYVSELKKLVHVPARSEFEKRRLAAALDGEPGRKLYDLAEAKFLQQTGTFFSGSAFAARLMQTVNVESSTIAVDPACGVGDLLIAFARQLPLGKDFWTTAETWGRQIYGCDIHPEFVQATKLRLCLLIIERGLKLQGELLLSDIFPNIVTADGLKFQPCQSPTLVLMNPPYTWARAPKGCVWAEGSICQAALFIDTWLSICRSNATILAILPDVLRTGANYRAWRSRIEERATVEEIDIIGRFNPSVDVDVFQIELNIAPKAVRQRQDCWRWYLPQRTRRVVGDYFVVKNGTIVPHRDKKEGELTAYLHAKNAFRWTTIKRLNERIRTKQPTFHPPFVVVRRTSSPSDKDRATATIITGSRRVAVENHLLVLEPRTGSIHDCVALLRVLKSSQTNKWLNTRIRCRHLTVSAVRDLPWWES